MEKIRERDIDFSTLNRLKCQANSESRIYHDATTLYKMYKDLDSRELKRKQRKIELLNEDTKLEHVVIPNTEIFKNHLLSGCAMDYIPSSNPLYDFTKVSHSINQYLKLVYQVSVSVRNIHNDPRNIVIGDLSFSNIIFDKNMRYYFIDFDSCMIDNLKADRIPAILSDYNLNRGISTFDINKNTDRLCIILCTLYTIFTKDIDNMSMYDYDMLAERVAILKKIRKLVLEIKKSKRSIPFVPYIDELMPKSIIEPPKKILTRIKEK